MSRAKLRGKKLDADCKNAKITTNECGTEDNRKFCYGLLDMSTETPRSCRVRRISEQKE